MKKEFKPIHCFTIAVSSFLGTALGLGLIYPFTYEVLDKIPWIGYVMYPLGVIIGLWEFRDTYYTEVS